MPPDPPPKIESVEVPESAPPEPARYDLLATDPSHRQRAAAGQSAQLLQESP